MMSSKMMFVNAHKIAKMIVETVGDYMVAFKLALKQVWSDVKGGKKRYTQTTLNSDAAYLKGEKKTANHNSFDNFRFNGLHFRKISNKYLTMNRVSDNENKIVVKVASEHLLPTKYGYALILDKNHVVFVKDWQISENYFGNEVVLDRKYWNVKEWGNFEQFDTNEKNYEFNNWLEAAKEQDALRDEDGLKANEVRF